MKTLHTDCTYGFFTYLAHKPCSAFTHFLMTLRSLTDFSLFRVVLYTIIPYFQSYFSTAILIFFGRRVSIVGRPHVANKALKLRIGIFGLFFFILNKYLEFTTTTIRDEKRLVGTISYFEPMQLLGDHAINSPPPPPNYIAECYTDE